MGQLDQSRKNKGEERCVSITPNTPLQLQSFGENAKKALSNRENEAVVFDEEQGYSASARGNSLTKVVKVGEVFA